MPFPFPCTPRISSSVACPHRRLLSFAAEFFEADLTPVFPGISGVPGSMMCMDQVPGAAQFWIAGREGEIKNVRRLAWSLIDGSGYWGSGNGFVVLLNVDRKYTIKLICFP